MCMKIREILHNFIFKLDDFLSAEAVVDSKIELVYATEPQKTIDGYVSYGAVSLMGKLYEFEVRYDKHMKTVEISSSIFWFRRKIGAIRKFLEEISNS